MDLFSQYTLNSKLLNLLRDQSIDFTNDDYEAIIKDFKALDSRITTINNAINGTRSPDVLIDCGSFLNPSDYVVVDCGTFI